MAYGYSLPVCWCCPWTKWVTTIHCLSVDAVHGQNELRLFIACLLMLSMDKMSYGYSLPVWWCYLWTKWVAAIHCQSVHAIHGQNELQLFTASLLMLSMDKMSDGYSLPVWWCYPLTEELRLFIASLLMLSNVCLIDYGLFLFFQGWSSSASFFCSFLPVSLLQAIDGVIIQALCPQEVSQAPQHFTDSMC